MPEEVESKRESLMENPPEGLGAEAKAFEEEKITPEAEELKQKIAETEKELARLVGEGLKAETKAEGVGAESPAAEGAATRERSEAGAVPPAPSTSPKPTKPDVSAIKQLSPKEQVDILCEMAFDQGIREAIKVARELDNAYVLDEFHDTLIDQLYQKLIEEKKISKV